MSSGLTPAQEALLAQRLRGRAGGRSIPRAAAGPAPVTAEQQQLLFHTWFTPADPLYNEAVTVLKDGPVDLDALRTAFAQLVDRHSIWRTTFVRRGGRSLQVVGKAAEFPIPLYDLSGLPGEEQEATAAALLTEQTLRPYDLDVGPLVRPLLVRFDAGHHRLFLSMHHLVFDGVSLYRVVLPELAVLYDAAVKGRPAGLPEPLQYADYASWQHDGALTEELTRHLPYWREHLAGAPTLRLPLDHERPAARRFHGTTAWFTVPADVARRLQQRGQDRGATLFQVLVAAFALLLHELTGDEEVVFATVADLRRRRELESMLGYCVTPVPLRLSVTPRFEELVDAARTEILDALGHLLPFSKLVEDLNPPHPPGANPVFQAMIVLEPQSPSPDPAWRLHQLDSRTGDALGQAKNDLHIELDQRPDGELSGRLIVTTDLFAPGFATTTAQRWTSLLERLSGP